ncbi:NmrA family NAD(P)-binding protein [Rhizobium sp. BG4]|uniref:NmrA family NAD(P)-binding protein n=1 Tax=Rhizobium sp. BG4 TaxID=2613770 RepID=UPI00193D45E9|nr:NmrA family NAD(P)-binding protein [Rhizobium sp. BG4]QRM47228.1 NAD(P)H-binding protein [Rhizobium sp. BG4]
MYAITGANGQTGSAAMRYLLKKNVPVKAILRKMEQGQLWIEAGAEVAVVDLLDTDALINAFRGARGAYLMNPPAYADPDIFGHSAAVHASLIAAAEAAALSHVVALSSVGAQHTDGTGNIKTTHDLERRLTVSKVPATIVRAANFMENWSWSLERVNSDGVLLSMFSPLSRRLPMVSVMDVGRVVGEQLLAGTAAPSLIELHGPKDYSPNDAASALSEILGRPVEAVLLPPACWNEVFAKAGFSTNAIKAFCELYRGFNNGHTAFEGRGVTMRGETTLSDALRLIVDR